jgi:ubiquitin C-terminal hydrolase
VVKEKSKLKFDIKRLKSQKSLKNQKKIINKAQNQNKVLNKKKEFPKTINIIKYNEFNENENKSKMRHNLNDSSNISLPPLIYKNQIFRFKKPLFVGLNNLGFTCYLNSILQCLNQTEPLVNYFLSEEGISKINNNNLKNDSLLLQLSPSYLEVVNNLWDIKNNNNTYTPLNFYSKLSEMNNNFILNKPNDSKDLLKFIFKQFHKELNTKTIKQNNKNNKTDSNFEKYDRAKTFNNFLKDFTNNNCSIISNNFYGITEINIECLKCKEFFLKEGIMMKPIIYDFKIYNMLIFPLEEIKTMKNKSNNKIKNNDKFSIYDCFEFLRNKNHNEGKNIFCKRCNQLSEVINISKLFSAPNILIIILNRGKGNAYNMKIEFDEVIDVTDYIEYKQNKVIYNLYGVVTHLGKNGDEGHFIAICKNLIDNTWYKYNDSDINIIKNIKKEILEFGKPYILFFQKSF